MVARLFLSAEMRTEHVCDASCGIYPNLECPVWPTSGSPARPGAGAHNQVGSTAQEQLARLQPEEPVANADEVRRFLLALLARPREALALARILDAAREGGRT
jgi:hypothetical protein